MEDDPDKIIKEFTEKFAEGKATKDDFIKSMLGLHNHLLGEHDKLILDLNRRVIDLEEQLRIDKELR